MNMPKANVVLADGTKVTIDGTADEVAALLQRISGSPPQPLAGDSKKRTGRRRGRTVTAGSGKGGSGKAAPKGPADYVRDLVAANYFKTKRGLGDVRCDDAVRYMSLPAGSWSPCRTDSGRATCLTRPDGTTPPGAADTTQNHHDERPTIGRHRVMYS